MDTNEIFCERYTKLLTDCWQDVQSGKLTVTRHFIGEEYAKSDLRLMVVGRAVNGWESDFSACASPEDVAKAVLSMRSPFDDIVKRDGVPSTGPNGEKWIYHYSRSAFWRMVQKLLEKHGESESWYDDPQMWNERVVWSNLYKISPRYSGNPGWRLIRPRIGAYIELLKAEIEACNPKHILLVTDLDFLDHYPNKPEIPSFVKALHIQPQTDRGGIVGTGRYGEASIVVCKRPEFHSGGEDALVQSIYEAFRQLDQ